MSLPFFYNQMQGWGKKYFLEIAAVSRMIQLGREVLGMSWSCIPFRLLHSKQTINRYWTICFCWCFPGLPNPALQALCKLITASETGEQLINRVSGRFFSGTSFQMVHSRSVNSETHSGLCCGLSASEAETLHFPVCVNESVCGEKEKVSILLGCMALDLTDQWKWKHDTFCTVREKQNVENER